MDAEYKTRQVALVSVDSFLMEWAKRKHINFSKILDEVLQEAFDNSTITFEKQGE